MAIKYGFNWVKDEDGYLGINLENSAYGIGSTLNKDGSWTHELLTRQKNPLTGSYSYELPRNEKSWVDSEDILKVVAVVEKRIAYWKAKKNK